jgi:hypothetical protein
MDSLLDSRDGRAFVDQIVDLIVRSDIATAQSRSALWSDIGASMKDPDMLSDPTPFRSESEIVERLLRKRWATFDSAARTILARLDPAPSGLQTHPWMDKETLEKQLGFDGRAAGAIIAAHQACVRVLGDRWTGTDEQLQQHAATLEGAIRRLYVQFPGMIDEARGAV